MKLIVIGPSLSGKTTLVKYIRSVTDTPVMEMDEELTQLNKGEYPEDTSYKDRVLAPQIVENVLEREIIIFFTNTNYFTLKDLKQAKERGFSIAQLDLSLKELERRNKKRVENESYENMNRWLSGMLEYQESIREAGLVDTVVDANQSTETIVRDLGITE